ncbi:YHYH protein [Roseibium sediminicola]|uniref:YHYH protein n=1 Tax=Roseibium sediminicola TaxID=2933272 RepID=A0ABT0GYI0_9HYPH|nr:YHYH protein [Roseibium sp. CAU 1639]MCK7614495.1 YHYH protein [Roseibium sp. CAU 1639]
MRIIRLAGLAALLAAVFGGGLLAAHAHDITVCTCDQACYTDEVAKVSCERGRARFFSHGLPDPKDPMMRGITATNQQFPALHNYEFEILLKPELAGRPTRTDAGPVGVAVNGVPIFDPSTQGPADRNTGKRPSAFEAGELDVCGGHAGRGDDYHYHIAPKCLIEDLGPDWVEQDKKPIGYAMDGFPILALGWFDKKNAVEKDLDPCRGMKDASGQYFYNVKTTSSWDVLNCLSGRPQHFARDRWFHRQDRTGKEITGIPIRFAIEDSSRRAYGGDVCHVMTGVLQGEQLLLTEGRTRKVRAEEGALFYCNKACYGLFFEADRSRAIRGRAIYYDRIADGCPRGFDVSGLKTFTPYEGPAQSRKGPPPMGR